MKWLKKLGSWTAKNAGTIAKVALPIAGFAVGMVAPGVGATIGKLADKLGNKVAGMTGIGDGKPGVFGIGDGLPGILGVGTGKARQAMIDAAVEKIKALTSKVNSGVELSPPEQLELQQAKKQADRDMKKDGINPLVLVGGGLLALFAFGGNSRR